MENFFDQVRALDWAPIAFAIVLGGIIGFEREWHGRAAGLRTHMLVCLASTMLIAASRQIPPESLVNTVGGRLVMDPNRLAAGIVTGVGFLGAGTVIRSGDLVRGITTGATVWFVACLGVLLGQGEYALATFGTLATVMVLAGFSPISRRVKPVIYRRLVVTGRDVEMPVVTERVRAILGAHAIRVQDISGKRGGQGEPFEIVFYMRCRNEFQAPDMLDQIAREPGISNVEWALIA